ncbi:dimethyladenosine transferase 2, mitochondrial-like [Ctenocephalides felis]|uniref:dimethyladenosine transferase 2, mitochondrial-like n=1 Tax=Ctenocephalides felis TaxID=7515 RepID=UPI000E6E341B|nr:dimethyladenosine transferase 2, mitochondrial-like [Ctenocephalides felis]
MKCFSSIKYLITGSKFKLDLIRANNVYKKPQALFNICSRFFSNEINPSITNDEEQIPSKPVKKKEKTPEKSKTNVLIHLENDANFQEIKDQIPEKLFKYRRVAPEGLYLINKDTAYDILFAILPYLQTSSAGESSLIEVNPGLGLLTDLLLNNWSREITLYEPNTQFVKALNALNEVHRNRINLYYTSFYDVWKLSYQDKHTSSKKVAALLGDLPQIPWGKDFCSTIIGIAPSNSFLNHLITSLVFQHSLMMWGRHQFFLVITPRQYIHYTCNGNTGYMFYRASSIMFQILFKFKFLCKVPRKSFLPWVQTFLTSTT